MGSNTQIGNKVLRMPNYKIRKNYGFTYLGLLFIIVLLGINLALAGTLYSFAQQREKERELIFVGNQFIRAISLYYQSTPGTIKRYPRNFEDLLMDNRFVNLQRYLRKIYFDPITRTQEWGIVRAPDGGIMGVYSQSTKKPLKTSDLSLHNSILNKESYQDWQFIWDANVTSIDNIVPHK